MKELGKNLLEARSAFPQVASFWDTPSILS